MTSGELNRQLQRLNALIESTSEATGNRLELQGHWGRYLCVLVAGFLENVLTDVYTRYATSASNDAVGNYAASNLELIQNPKARRFVETARAFRRDWAEQLELFLDDQGRREAIDSIMSNRHLIAHGQDAGITVVRVKEYLTKCVEVIDFIEIQCGL